MPGGGASASGLGSSGAGSQQVLAREKTDGSAKGEGSTPGVSGLQMSSSGGGGASSYGGPSNENYLPPLPSNLPHMKDGQRVPASVGGATADPHPDITGKYSNLFEQVSHRLQLYCQMKELVGCN